MFDEFKPRLSDTNQIVSKYKIKGQLKDEEEDYSVVQVFRQKGQQGGQSESQDENSDISELLTELSEDPFAPKTAKLKPKKKISQSNVDDVGVKQLSFDSQATVALQGQSSIEDRTEVKTVDSEVVQALRLLGDLKIIVAETEKQHEMQKDSTIKHEPVTTHVRSKYSNKLIKKM